MMARGKQVASGDAVDSDFGGLVEGLTARLQAGEPVDWSALARDNPDHADELSAIRPSLEALGRLSRAGESAVAGVAPTADDDLLPGVLGDFRIVREIGRGGMGVVYEAEQISLNRNVALKVLPFAATMDPRQLQRFRHEAQAAAMLHHPNVVPVFGVGCERGVHYFAMQLIPGCSLAAMIDELRTDGRAGSRERPEDSQTLDHVEAHGALTQPRSPETSPVAALTTQRTRRDKAHYRHIAELIAQAADAVEYAHTMGVVHRDIKPANLLLDEAGHLWVTDFGLAKFDTAVGMTVSGDLIGTLRYMSPEQALARHGMVDHRTDVYSLGATLYELLTLRPAVDGADKHELLKKIAFEEPVTLRKLEKTVPVELETVTLKAMTKNPTERYATAGELADDLRRWLGDQTIKAKPPTLRQKAGKWARRHPAATITLTLAVTLGLAAALVWDRQKSMAEATAREVAGEATRFQAAGRYAEALAVARRAADLLPRFGGDAALRRAVDELAADFDLLCKLEEARLEEAEVSEDGSGFDSARRTPLFRQAFLEYGIDVLAGEEADVADRLARRAVRAEIAAALNDWSHTASDPREKQRLGNLAEALDPLGITARVRRAGLARDAEALKQLAVEVAGEAPPAVLCRLAKKLVTAPAPVEAERLLRAGLMRYPGDFWLNMQLSLTIREVSRRAGTIDSDRGAESLRFQQAALTLRPHSPGVWLNVGWQLFDLNRYDEAEAALRRAIELKPDYAQAYGSLGYILMKASRPAEAKAAYLRAIELRPAYANYHYNMARVLSLLKRLPEAEAALRRAIELKPDYALAHYTLGTMLKRAGRRAEAVAHLRRATELDPNRYQFHHNLGNSLKDTGRPAEAEAANRRAIELKPDFAESHCNLAAVLQALDRFADSLEEFRRGHDLGSQQPDWKYTSAEWVRTAERLVALEDKLPALLAGNTQLADAEHQVVLTQYCTRKKRYATAVRFYAAAFAAKPALAEDLRAGHRYDAARCAAVAAAGQGTDAALLDDTERSRLRRQALDWWTADLALRRKQDVGGSADARREVQQKLQSWQQDPDFAIVREDDALARLPEAERVAWQKLWADVAEMLKRTAEPRAAAKAPPKP